jgi:trimeric autotransporter adhesin
MGTTLENKKIKDTYKSLIKVTDNTEAGSSGKQLSDGAGNDFGVYIDTDGTLGIGGAAEFSLDAGGSTDAFRLPKGTTVQRDALTASAGIIRYNTSTSKFEIYDSGWKNIFTESGGTIDGNVTVTGNLTVEGSTTTISSETVTFEDNILLINKADDDDTAYNTVSAGIEIEETGATNPSFIHTFSDSLWTLSDSLKVNQGDLTVTKSGGVNLTMSAGAAGGTHIKLTPNTTGNGTGRIYTTNTLNLALGVNSSDILHLTSDNRVGIGTDSPTANLEINTGSTSSINIASQTNGSIAFGNGSGSSQNPLIVGKSTSNTSALTFIGAGANANTSGDIVFNARENNNSTFATLTNAAFKFKHYTTDLVTILRNGNLGIGNTSPTRPLTVSGEILDTNTPILVKATSKDNAYIAFQDSGTTGELYNRIGSEDNDLVFRANNTERMRITSVGDLQFADSVSLNPASDKDKTLDFGIDGKTWSNITLDANNFYFKRDGSIKGTYDLANNMLGIGTTSPSNNIHVFNSGNGTIAAERSSGSTVLMQAQAALGQIGTTTNHNLQLLTNGSGRVTITTAGRVGIGETSPSKRVHIKGGNDTEAALQITRTDQSSELILGFNYVGTFSNANMLLFSNSTQRIAITNNGAIEIKGQGTGNTFIGDSNAGNLGTTTGTYNTAFGNNGLNALTTGAHNVAIGFSNSLNTTTGNGNVVLGSQSLYYNTVGDYNIAIGYQALHLQSADINHNIGIGYQTLYNENTSGNNVAIGYASMKYTNGAGRNIAIGSEAMVGQSGTKMTGDENIGIGYNALNTNTSGYGNVAMGYRANSQNTTGSYNIALGFQALNGNTTPTHNIALGYQALFEENTNGGNIAIGREALKTSNGGSGNVSIGYQSTLSLTTGDENAIVGTQAGSYLTTGSYNAVLGAYAFDAGTTTDYNVAIGYGALTSQTTADHNTAVGYLAGQNETTSGNSTYIGSRAGRYVKTGSYNVALGMDALYGDSTNFSTGDNNVALGYKTLFENNTGTQNVAIGSESLYDNTTGSYNISIGQAALSDNTTGSNNVAIGVRALELAAGANAYSNVAVGTRTGKNLTSNSNVAIGYEALEAATDAQGNSIIGHNAGHDITTGDFNVALGYNALANATTAGVNVAIGAYALDRVTAQGASVAIGAYSMGNTTSGHGNTAVGYNTMAQNTTGNSNTAIGYQSLDSNTNGYYNTAIGHSSLGANTTGNVNTAIGQNALASNTTGSNNTAVGSTALVNNTEGSYNTAIGQGALYDSTTGVRNTAIGWYAGSENTTGARNTFLGMYTGRFLNDGTTALENASDCVYIGYDTRSGSSTSTVGNEIVIGKDARGNGSNTATYGNSSITKHVFAGGSISLGSHGGSTGHLDMEKAYAGSTAIHINTTTANTTYVPLEFNHNGTLVGYVTASTTATAYLTSSDHRLKENVVDLTGALDRLDNLSPRRFNFIAESDTTVDGFIAHEVQTVVPEAVSGTHNEVDDDGNAIYQGIDQAKLVPLLTAALQEAHTIIKDLKSRVEALENA